MWALSLLLGFLPSCYGLDNGLALTPPMGWMNWKNIDCNYNQKCTGTIYNRNCITADQLKVLADDLINNGYVNAGYEYLVLDDCAINKRKTDSDGRLIANETRFPEGIRELADYLHAKGLKLGMRYSSTKCYKYPDSKDIIKGIADSISDWDLDYIKLNICLGPSRGKPDEGFSELRKLLNQCNKKTLIALYDLYLLESPLEPNYALLAENFNAWQLNIEVNNPHFENLTKRIDRYGVNQTRFIKHIHPGSWTDYGKLILGSPDMLEDYARAQMAIWAIIGSPLFFVGDVHPIKPEIKRILLNKDIINVNQDLMGIPGLRILKRENSEVWKRKLHGGRFAIAFLNSNARNGSRTFYFTHADLQLPKRGYLVTDLYGKEKPRFWDESCNLTVKINNEGANFYTFKKGHLVLRLRHAHKYHSNRNRN